MTRSLIRVFSIVFLMSTAHRAALGDDSRREEHHNMELVGFSAVQGRPIYQPVIQHQGNRWIAYLSHHNDGTGQSLFNPLTGQDEHNGLSIVDVTDPRRPVFLHHIPGPDPTGGGQMVRLCSGRDLPIHDNRWYLLRPFDGTHEIWDVTDPSNPQFVVTIVSGLTGTHKSWWECDTGIAYLVSSGPDGWLPGNMMRIYDLGNPADAPNHFIRNWALNGQQPGGPPPPPPLTDIPNVHGPISLGPAGNRVYIPYGVGNDGVMQIVDRSKLLPPPYGTGDPDDYESAEVGRLVMSGTPTQSWGAHTSLPLLGIRIPGWQVNTDGKVRDFVVVTSEETSFECQDVRQLTFMVDVSVESRPQVVSNFQVPERSGHFCSRGGRFGPHATNEDLGRPSNPSSSYLKRLVFISYFNAGVRAVDIRDPYSPREVGFYIPPTNSTTLQTCGTIHGEMVCKTVVQTNNVDVDDRGLVYIADRVGTGMHILRLTGEAARIGRGEDEHEGDD
jgi:hypothetical protein